MKYLDCRDRIRNLLEFCERSGSVIEIDRAREEASILADLYPILKEKYEREVLFTSEEYNLPLRGLLGNFSTKYEEDKILIKVNNSDIPSESTILKIKELYKTEDVQVSILKANPGGSAYRNKHVNTKQIILIYIRDMKI